MYLYQDLNLGLLNTVPKTVFINYIKQLKIMFIFTWFWSIAHTRPLAVSKGRESVLVTPTSLVPEPLTAPRLTVIVGTEVDG